MNILIAKINDRKLPSIGKLHSRLTGGNISEEEYVGAKYIVKLFKRKHLDYTKLCLISNVLNLSDVIETFRNVALKNRKLDLLNFVSAPGLT